MHLSSGIECVLVFDSAAWYLLTCVEICCGNHESLHCCRMEGQIEEGDLVRLRSKWQETMGKIHGAAASPPRIAPE